jgi:5-formyltetrahydrofolate cyclo-ligase
MLEFRHVGDLAADLVPGVWGIREPAQHCPPVDPATVDFLLVPGVAFTPSGARLGYGGGFYDRLLALLDRRTVRIAGAFQLQMVEQLPEGPQDQRVSKIVTEQ